jgi:hypothetical protein
LPSAIAGARRVRRPFHALACLGTAAHHAFELGAGVGLVFQPYIGLRRAGTLWGLSLPTWLRAAAAGSSRWDRPLAFLSGLALGGSAVHFTLWPWTAECGPPMLTSAEGLRPELLPAYNAVLYAWGMSALAALALETPRGTRRWGLAGLVAAIPLRASARHHFRWLSEQARSNPAWWNRGVRAPAG